MQIPLRSLRHAILSLALCALPLLPACAQNSGAASASDNAQLDQILSSQVRVHAIGQVAISPDGKRLAWIEGRQIHVAPLPSLDQGQRVTAASSPGGSCSESSIIWSPDSAALAFLSDCADLGGQSDLYLTRLDGAPAMRITALHGYVHAPAFSPDGKSIAFLYVEGATRPSGALAAEPLPSGVIGEDHIEIQRVAFAPTDAATPAAPTFATPANLHVYEFDWSPDSKSVAYIAADPPGENNWWVAKLYTQELGAYREGRPYPLHRLRPAPRPANRRPRWSPDGKSIAFIGGLMSDQGVTGGDVWIVPSDWRQTPRSHARPPHLSAVDHVGWQPRHLRQRARRRKLPTGSLGSSGRSRCRQRLHFDGQSHTSSRLGQRRLRSQSLRYRRSFSLCFYVQQP